MKTFGLSFYLKKEKVRKDGTAPIYARITIDRKRAEFAIKRYINPNEWDENTGGTTGRRTEARELNAYMKAIQTRLYQHHRELLDRKEVCSALALKNALLGISDRGKTLLEALDYHIGRMEDLRGIEFAPNTLTKVHTTRKHIRAFLRYQYQREDIELQRLAHRFISDFDHYLRSHCNIGHNTTVKYISIFRKFINRSIELGWLDKDPFVRYKGRPKIVDREYLTEAELQSIVLRKFDFERLDLVRDLFVFACYTGLAYIDVSKLTADHISRGVQGERWIRLNRTKTKAPSMIPLLPPALAILEKYSEDPEAQAKGRLLPVKSNQKMNAYLKEIADLCSIRKKLTFHVARHTFATTVTLSNGVPIESVSAMLGHRSIKSTQHYAKIVQRKVGEDMQALKGKLFGENEEPKQFRKLS